MTEQIIKPPTEARQGSKEGVVRWILGISTSLVVVVMVVLFIVAR